MQSLQILISFSFIILWFQQSQAQEKKTYREKNYHLEVQDLLSLHKLAYPELDSILEDKEFKLIAYDTTHNNYPTSIEEKSLLNTHRVYHAGRGNKYYRTTFLDRLLPRRLMRKIGGLFRSRLIYREIEVRQVCENFALEDSLCIHSEKIKITPFVSYQSNRAGDFKYYLGYFQSNNKEYKFSKTFLGGGMCTLITSETYRFLSDDYIYDLEVFFNRRVGNGFVKYGGIYRVVLSISYRYF